MKKALYGMVIAGLISGTALAGGPDMMMPTTEFKPFLGVNYSYLSVQNGTNGPFTGNANSFNGMGFEAGLKYGHYLGFVTGWNHYFSEVGRAGGTFVNPVDGSTTTFGAATVAPESYYFDVRGYYPVMSQFDLIGSVGAGLLDVVRTSSAVFTDSTGDTFSGNVSREDNQVNLRLGAGADYYFTPNWGVQGMFNWSPSHGISSAGYNNWWTITAGIYYMFS